MNVRTASTALVLVVLAVACGADQVSSVDGVFFPTVKHTDGAYPSALMRGRLVETHGCLFAEAGSERWLLLWPDGYTVATGPDRRIEVRDETGDPVAVVGDTFAAGGGETNPVEVGGTAAADKWAHDLVGEDIPAACGHLFWLVSGVVSA